MATLSGENAAVKEKMSMKTCRTQKEKQKLQPSFTRHADEKN
jgi:hypothetical protein